MPLRFRGRDRAALMADPTFDLYAEGWEERDKFALVQILWRNAMPGYEMIGPDHPDWQSYNDDADRVLRAERGVEPFDLNDGKRWAIPEGSIEVWRHCSPELLHSGYSCGEGIRRACACDFGDPLSAGHDHLIEVSSTIFYRVERAEGVL